MSLAACERPPEDTCETADELLGCQDGEDWGNGDTTDWPRPPAFEPTYVPYDAACPGNVCPLAVGGTSTLRALTNDAVNPLITLTGGSARATLLSVSDREESYTLTSTNTQGDTAITLTSSNWPTVIAELAVRSVRDVQLLPDPLESYEAATDDPAWFTHAKLTVALIGDPGAAITAPLRLVDATLSAGELVAIDWDRYHAPHTAGTHVLELTADSFGTREIEIETVWSIDRFEAVVQGEPATGESTRVCFHGYSGDREVYSAVLIETSTDVQLDGARNCASVSFPEGATRRVVTARAHGLTRVVELVIP